jgi:putative hydrolase of the HAD superfamily
MALVDAPGIDQSIDGVIFDYGCVLVADQTSEDQERMAAVAGVPLQDLMPAYWADRLAYDRGDLSGAQYWQANGNRCGVSFNADQIERLIDLDNRSWMHYDEPMWDWLNEVRRSGKRVAILSNMPRDLGEVLRSETDRLDRFDHITLSYQVRSAKPDRAIYEHCIQGIGTEPGRTLFLDDREANIVGGEALGIRGMRFVSRTQLFEDLNAR